MAVPKNYNNFQETGWPAVCKTKWFTSGSTLTCPTDKAIHLLGFICNASTTFNNGGTLLSMDAGEPGFVRLPGAVDCGKNNDLAFTTTGDVTLFYYIHDPELDNN